MKKMELLKFSEPPQIVRTAQKKPPNIGNEILSNMLTSFFQRRQFCFSLDALVVVEVDVIINGLSCLCKRGKLYPVDAFRFKNREEVFS